MLAGVVERRIRLSLEERPKLARHPGMDEHGRSRQVLALQFVAWICEHLVDAEKKQQTRFLSAVQVWSKTHARYSTFRLSDQTQNHYHHSSARDDARIMLRLLFFGSVVTVWVVNKWMRMQLKYQRSLSSSDSVPNKRALRSRRDGISSSIMGFPAPDW